MVERFSSWLVLWLIIAGTCWGQSQEQLEKPANALVEIKPSKPSAVIVQEPLGLEFRSYLLADGTQAIIFHTGTHKRIVLATFTNGPNIPLVTQYVIRIGKPEPEPEPEPEPPEPVDPRPDGFAGQVYDKAKSVSMGKTVALDAADNFESVVSQIAAGGLQNMAEALDKIAELNANFWPRSTEPFVTWASNYLQANAKTLSSLKVLFEQITEGLRAWASN